MSQEQKACCKHEDIYKQLEIVKSAIKIGEDVKNHHLASHGLCSKSMKLHFICDSEISNREVTLMYNPHDIGYVYTNMDSKQLSNSDITKYNILIWSGDVTVYYHQGSEMKSLRGMFNGGVAVLKTIDDLIHWPTTIANNGEFILFFE